MGVRVVGPFTFDVAHFDGSLPHILLNPYSWTKVKTSLTPCMCQVMYVFLQYLSTFITYLSGFQVASIIFVDWPVGTGFSYSNTSQGCSSSDTKSAKDTHTFLRKVGQCY